MNAALKAIWEQSAGQIDTMVMNGTQNDLLLPYRAFLTAAQEVRHDLERLADIFGASSRISASGTMRTLA